VSRRDVDWGARAHKRAGTSVDLDDRISLDVQPASVWQRLQDVDAVANCLPGLVPGSLVALGDDKYNARLEHSAMGMTAHWDLRATMQLTDDRRLRVLLDGDDKRLNLAMNGWAEVDVQPENANRTALDYKAHIRVDGSLAALGGPIVRGIVTDALQRFMLEVSGDDAAAERATTEGRVRGFFTRLLARLRRARRRTG
jgi:carbon monoxide dehydrogenase subunit G